MDTTLKPRVIFLFNPQSTLSQRLMNIKIKVGVFYPDLFLYTLKISFIPSSVSWASIACSYIPNLLFDFHEWYSMKIKEQTRKRAAGCTWVRQGEADVVWIWFSKSMRSLSSLSTYFILTNRFVEQVIAWLFRRSINKSRP